VWGEGTTETLTEDDRRGCGGWVGKGSMRQAGSVMDSIPRSVGTPFVRRRDFLAAGITRWKYAQLLDVGALHPLKQELAGAKRRHHLFPAVELGRTLKAFTEG
jgi:hypothetical protein